MTILGGQLSIFLYLKVRKASKVHAKRLLSFHFRSFPTFEYRESYLSKIAVSYKQRPKQNKQDLSNAAYVEKFILAEDIKYCTANTKIAEDIKQCTSNVLIKCMIFVCDIAGAKPANFTCSRVP
jgi:hypothetical protein